MPSIQKRSAAGSLMAAAALALMPAQAAANLIYNPGFEMGITGWTDSSINTGPYTMDPSDPRTGAFDLAVSTVKNGGWA